MARTLPLIAAVAATALLSNISAPSAEEKKEYQAPGAKKEMLLHQVGLAAGDQLEARVIRFDLPAGHQGGRHHHTGDLIVYIQSGTLSVETSGGTQTYMAGEAFYETPGQVMRAENKSTSDNTVLIVFQVGAQGEPLMVKAE